MTGLTFIRAWLVFPVAVETAFSLSEMVRVVRIDQRGVNNHLACFGVLQFGVEVQVRRLGNQFFLLMTGQTTVWADGVTDLLVAGGALDVVDLVLEHHLFASSKSVGREAHDEGAQKNRGSKD